MGPAGAGDVAAAVHGAAVVAVVKGDVREAGALRMRRRAIQRRVMYARFMWNLPGYREVLWADVPDWAVWEQRGYA